MAAVVVVAFTFAGCGRTMSLGSTSETNVTAQRLAAPASGELGPRVALTFDDLGATSAAGADVSRHILKALADAKAPAGVFANCKELDPQALMLWHRAGATIGNHTGHHLSIDAQDAAGTRAGATWSRDVEDCDQRLRTLVQKPVKYFRYPFLRYGSTEDRKRMGAAKLASLGYQVAHVTAATSEWLLAQYYEAALQRGDTALGEEIALGYVEHMVKTLATARQMAFAKVGRDVAQITLMHVNRLAADRLPAVLAALRSAGWAFVSLEQALADPVYALPDVYVGGCGCSWLARIHPALRPQDDYAFGDDEDRIHARFASRVDALNR